MKWCSLVLCFFVCFCKGLDVCQMDLNYFNINSIKDLNFTKSEGANNCEATYTYSKEEKLKLNCTSKLSNFDRNYISMAWRFNDSQKGEVVYLNETRSEINSIHNYYLPQEFDIGSNNNGSMIKCELAKLYPNGTYNQDKPVTESLIIHLLWIQQETPTDAPFSNLNRSIVKRNVIEPQFTEENNVSFELKVSKNNATCLTVKRYDFVIKEKEETMINVVVSSCKRIKYGNCNTSKPENNIQFKNLDQQKKSSKCNAEQKVFEAIEKIEINESTILRCSFLTHKNNKANIFPRVTINSTKYVETVCTTEINVKFIPPATISTNTTIISSVDKDNQEIPKINDTNTTIVTTKKISFAAKVTKKESINEKRSEEQTQVENNSVIEDNKIFLNNTKGKTNRHPPQGIMEYLWFKIAIIGIVCIAIILVVIHMLKRRLKEDSEPMINSSGGHQESSDVQQFPPNLESHYAKPLDTRVEGETYSVPINENNIETFYTMPVPKQQRSNMRKVLPDLNEKVNVNKNRNPVYSEINHRAVPKYTNLFNDGRYVNGKIDTDYAEPTYYDMNT